MSIIQNLLTIIDQELEKHGATRLVRVTVRYGRLANVVPDAMSFAWEALTRETPHEGAELLLEEVPLVVECRRCKAHFTPEETHLLLMTCPECGEDLGHTVLSGRELHVENIEAT